MNQQQKPDLPSMQPSVLRTIEPSPQARTSTTSLMRGWPLLLVCLIWAGASLGCVSISYLTEIIRREDGSHGVDLVVEVALDQGVMQHVPESDPADQQESIDDAAALGWDCEYFDNGSRFLCRRPFATPEEFNQQALPALITFFEAEGEGVIATEISVAVETTAAGEPEYEVTYVAVAPDPDATGACEDENNDSIEVLFCDGFNELLASNLSEDAELLGVTEPFVEAVLAAEPPKFVFGVRLPGAVEDTYINGTPGGETIAPNEARFTLTAEDSGAFTFQAFGQPANLPVPSSETDAEETADETTTAETSSQSETGDKSDEFPGLAASALLDEPALTKIQEIQDTKAPAGSKTNAELASAVVKDLLDPKLWPTSVDAALAQEARDAYTDALYLALLQDQEGSLLFPNVHAGLQLSTHLMQQFVETGDERIGTALTSLTSLLVLQDLAP